MCLKSGFQVAKELAADPEAEVRLDEMRKAREAKWRAREAERKRAVRQSKKHKWAFDG